MRLTQIIDRIRPAPQAYANIYDVCDPVLRRGEPLAEPGRHLKLLYRKSLRNPLLRLLALRGCRHPLVPMARVGRYRDMLGKALDATPLHWRNRVWVRETFAPLAELLDKIVAPRWQLREAVASPRADLAREELDEVLDRLARHVFRVWDKDQRDPWFPVHAQAILSGDDTMSGEAFLDILAGLGSFEHQNVTMLFALTRCFLMACPAKLRLIRRPYRGLSEPLRTFGRITHRTAFYDAIFFEQLYTRAVKNHVHPEEFRKIAAILEGLVRYIVVTSSEELVSPSGGIRHPAITCLPKNPRGEPLCKLSRRNWKLKEKLGFGDYVPDADTTFLALSMARKWLSFVRNFGLQADPELRKACERFLNHPWIEIISEYQVGSGHSTNPPTNKATRPLDYFGAVPLWFDKPFRKPDGRIVREALGNDICPGHNMDILEAILVNRNAWRAQSGKNLETVKRFIEFHHRAFKSGNFRHESAVRFYLPSTYVHYAGRVWDVFKSMPEEDKAAIDPEGKLAEIRKIALEYCRRDLLGRTVNPLDAAQAVTALVLLEHEPRHDGLIAHGLSVMRQAMGEGLRQPYRAYEWTLVRQPTRIIVGSEIATSLFVLGAFAEARRYLHGHERVDLIPPRGIKPAK